MGIAFILFFFWKVTDLLTAYIAKRFDFYTEKFDYIFQLYHSNKYVPKFLLSFANYDGAIYLHIAHDGYKQYERVFFPLYPLLIHLLAPLFGNGYFLTGLFISNISFLLGLYFAKKYLEAIGKSLKTIYWTILFILSFPTSFYFGAVYTEGLFFMLVTASLYFAQTKRFKQLVLVSMLASLTRVEGVLLLFPVGIIVFINRHKIRLDTKPWKEKIKKIILIYIKDKKMLLISLSPVFGLAIFMVYLYLTTGDFLRFYHTQGVLHNGRSVNQLTLLPQVYYRYFKILFTASHNFIYFVAINEFIIFNLFFIVLLYNLYRLIKQNKKDKATFSLIGLNLFSLANLILPTLTGTLISLPRYALLSISFFICIAELKSKLLRIVLLALFFMFHLLLLSFFIQGYFIS